ncbi:MAG: helix-turn-helix domain-containing protein, partial [Anaerolineae bacterium]
MSNQQVIELRDRILGILIRNARERARVSRSECGAVLGVSSSTIASYEEGAKSISLPEMELLGRYLGVSLNELRDDNVSHEEEEKKYPDPELFLPLRHRIIGARLRQARLEAGRTQQDVADMVDCSSSTISAYEYGKSSIPLSELEVIARALGVPLDIFLDRDSEIGRWHQFQEEFERFTEMPPEMREFILRPINRSYLELAMKLASMPAGALRNIAEGLLEIT